MPRLVRRKPLRERLMAMLNPLDLLLWLSEEIESRNWDSKHVGTQVGLALNLIFFLCRAKFKSGTRHSDDIFGENIGSHWLAFIVYPFLWSLVAFSVTNAVYTISRTRKYRMFEAGIETKPSTPSARRVKVQSSSPASSSPLHYIAGLMAGSSAESRAHSDRDQEVWEISVWDPLPVALRLACFFSPGHVLVYLLFLPLAPLDPRPSMTIFNTLVMQALLSTQLLLLCSRFLQQIKDSAIIQKEVMHEYDTKFVHPRLFPVVRDVGTQLSQDQPVNSRAFVQLGTPATLIRRSFVTRANPYISESHETMPSRQDSYSSMTSHVLTPTPAGRRPDAAIPAGANLRSSAIRSSAFRNTLSAAQNIPAASQATSNIASSTNGHDFGGYMGVYTHEKSPLKKAMNLGNINSAEITSPRNSREMAAWEQRRRELSSSPIKKSESRQVPAASIDSSPHPFANMGRHRLQYERYPSRR